MLLWVDRSNVWPGYLDYVAHYQLEISARLSRLWKFNDNCASRNVVNAALRTRRFAPNKHQTAPLGVFSAYARQQSGTCTKAAGQHTG
jgi:hypothetical protein